MNNNSAIAFALAALASVIAAVLVMGQPLSSVLATSHDDSNSMHDDWSADDTMLAADNATTSLINQTKVVKQGTLSSPGQDSGPFQIIDILPVRDDGKVYVGQITFTATRPIFVAPLQTFGVGSETLDPAFGDLLVFPGGPNGTLVSPAIITPEYSDPIVSQIPIPQTFSASVPFAGNGLSVGNLNGEQFLISYTLQATVHVPEVEDDVQTAITDQPVINGTSVSIVAGAAGLNDTAYDPNPISISVGDNVTWVNDDMDPHTVTSMNFSTGEVGLEFDSGYMGLHRTFTHQFNEEGEFDYFCLLHPNMVGRVIVQ